MTEYEIYWKYLTDEAKEIFRPKYKLQNEIVIEDDTCIGLIEIDDEFGLGGF